MKKKTKDTRRITTKSERGSENMTEQPELKDKIRKIVAQKVREEKTDEQIVTETYKELLKKTLHLMKEHKRNNNDYCKKN